MSFRIYLITGMMCLLLIACQQDLQVKEEEKIALHHQVEAAQYNIQLAIAYLNQGSMPRSKKKILAALRLAPQSPDVQAAMGYYLEKTGELDNAKRYYQKALALAPDSGAQKNNYGAFLCRIGDYKPAIKLLVQAGDDETYPNSAMSYENAGICANAMHDEKNSMIYFTKALAQDSGRQVALYELVKLTLKNHEPKKALAYLNEHADLTLNNKAFLALALEAAQAEGNTLMAADYTQRLQNITEANYEHT